MNIVTDETMEHRAVNQLASRANGSFKIGFGYSLEKKVLRGLYLRLYSGHYSSESKSLLYRMLLNCAEQMEPGPSLKTKI